MNLRGQGALEYLLLIGGAVLIAAIVLTVLSHNVSNESDVIKQNTLIGKCGALPQNLCEDPSIGDVDNTHKGIDCRWDVTTKTCKPICKYSNGECIEG